MNYTAVGATTQPAAALALSPSYTTKVLALADSDSYLKWGAATLDSLGDEFDTSILILKSPIAPSPEQQFTALAGTPFVSSTVKTVGMNNLRSRLFDMEPDVVLLAGTGPIIEVAAEIARKLPRPPALISGIPGMALPARKKGLEFRARTQALIVHSQREAEEYGALLTELGLTHKVTLNRLPFLPAAQPAAQAITSVVFTPQALVPSSAPQRTAILHALHRVTVAHPEVEVIIKVRALAGERQTHNERYPYDLLWHDLCEQNPDLDPSSLTFAAGPLTDYLHSGAAHVTVSSTAALESISGELPTLVLSDFGVNERLLNAVYQGSGVLGTLGDLVDLKFGTPDPTWLDRNYFHTEPSELALTVMALGEESRLGTLQWQDPINLRKRRRRLTRNWLRSTLPAALVATGDNVSKAMSPRQIVGRLIARR